MHPALATNLLGIDLATPVLLAAGTAGVLDEMGQQLDLSRVGAVVTKSITPEPREGNAPWRVHPTPTGMLNAVGLANPGLDKFLDEHAPRIVAMPCPVIGSIAGFCIDDFVTVAGAFDALDAMPAVELNVSCPNVHAAGDFASTPELLGELTTAVRKTLSRTKLIVKLPPITTPAPHSCVDLARAAIDAGADALTLCNTTPALMIDVRTRRPVLGAGSGGLSGPAVHAPVVKIVHDVYRQVAADRGIPIIALGGVVNWKDAAEFVLAGASAVAVGTTLFADPRAPVKIAKGLDKWTRSQGASRPADLVGTLAQ